MKYLAIVLIVALLSSPADAHLWLRQRSVKVVRTPTGITREVKIGWRCALCGKVAGESCTSPSKPGVAPAAKPLKPIPQTEPLPPNPTAPGA